MATSLFECKRAPAFSFSRIFYKILTLETNNSLKYTDFRNSRFSPKPDCRSTGRSTDPSIGRPVGRPKTTESWALTVRELRSTGRSTASGPCACCACRSTWPVDRPACFSAAAAISCCCPLCLSSSTFMAITSTTLGNPVNSLAISSLSNNSPPR